MIDKKATLLAIYKKLGFKCIPLEGKRPYWKNWDSVEAWKSEIFSNERTLKEIADNPSRNIGIVCGLPSGIIAIDVDQPKITGYNPETAIKHGALAHTTSKAPRLIFRSSNPEVLNFSRKIIRRRNEVDEKQLVGDKDKQAITLIEILGTGRQFVAPPSIHPGTGEEYKWITPLPASPENIIEIKDLQHLKEVLFALFEDKSIVFELFEEKKVVEQKKETPPEILDEWLKAIEKALTSHLAEDKGDYVLYHCPFHPSDNHPSFAIYRPSYIAVDFHEPGNSSKWKVYTLKELAEALKIELPRSKKPEKVEVTNIKEEDEEEEEETFYNADIPPIVVRLPENNFVTRYIEMAKRRTDAYPEYHFAAAIAILSRIADRKLYLELLHETIYPNIWIWTLGDSTLSRKTTAMKIAKNLVRVTQLDIEDFFLPHSFSPEAFVEIMSDQPHGAFWLDEAGSLLASMAKPYMTDLRDLFCRLYDNEEYHRKLRTSKKSTKTEFRIEDPYLTHWLSTTPDTFKRHSTIDDLTSGWLFRYIYLCPEYLKEWRGYGVLTYEDKKMMADLANFLTKIAERVDEPIEMEFSPEALAWFHSWQRTREDDALKLKNKILTQLLGRYYTIAIKLAMLFELGEEEFKPVIRLEMIKEACRIVDKFLLPYAVKIIQELEWDEKTNLQERILGELRRAGGELTRRELQRKLHKPLDDVEKALQALQYSREIEIVEVPTEGRGRPRVIVRLTKKKNGKALKPVEIPEEKLNELKELFSKQLERKTSNNEDYVKITLKDGSTAEIPRSAWEKVKKKESEKAKQEQDSEDAFLEQLRPKSGLEEAFDQ